MQEEDVPVSEEFLLTLGNFLKENGKEAPFAIPVSAPTPSQASSKYRISEVYNEALCKQVILFFHLYLKIMYKL